MNQKKQESENKPRDWHQVETIKEKPMKRKSSDGTTGEKIFELWANTHGWKMVRTQPETKVVYVNNKPTVIHCKGKGVPDYTGYRMVDRRPTYTACEVKECDGNTMVASRLSMDQRKFMHALPPECSAVAIWWKSFSVLEVFNFEYVGSYKKGEGFF